MKTLLRLLSVALLGSFVALSACKDDDESNLSRTELLTQKPWKLTGIAIVGLGGATPPEDYQADDTYTFKTDGTFTVDEGALKFDSSDPQVRNGTWKFEENETILSVTEEIFTFKKEIKELTPTTLKVQYFALIANIEEIYGH